MKAVGHVNKFFFFQGVLNMEPFKLKNKIQQEARQ